MMHIQSFCERYGKWLFLFALIFTFAYSFFYEVHISNHDYLFYMHFVDEGDYVKHAMVSGTIWFSKPLWFLLGHKLWMWKVWAWGMACLTAVIPYYALLNKEQRNKYAYIMALVVLVLNLRYGLEPPKYAYLFNIVMLVCFVKYLQANKISWSIAVSMCVALMTFVRFPSVFVWPVVVFAMVVLRKNWKHTLSMILLPTLFFVGLVTITNGDIGTYFEDLLGNVGAAANGSHSIMNLFWGYVTSTTHAIAYMILICLPLFMYGMWKKKESAIFKVGYLFSFLLIAAIMIIHPTEHLSCALTMAVVLLCAFCNNWNLKQVVLGATIVITNMFCSVGSDCGFVHEYYCVSFVPFLFVNGITDDKLERKAVLSEKWSFDMLRLVPLFTTLTMILCLSTLADKCIVLGKKYSSGIVNGSELSTNLSGVYFSKQSMRKYSDLQKEYSELKKTHDEVIYWGTHLTHLMTFANNQWPVTRIWDISSKDKESMAFRDFSDYVRQNKPVVIDIEKHPNTEVFMKSQGYKITRKNLCNIYVMGK